MSPTFSRSCPTRVILASLATFAARGAAVLGQEPAARPPRPDIYDRTADGEKQIADALRIARRENKRVLLQFGANWCGWCHKLHDLFKRDKEVAHELNYEYELVLIDVDKVDGQTHNAEIDKRYGHPTRHGLPALVVLDADGKALTTQDTGQLEQGDHHDPAKVLAFLKQWKPDPLSADGLLSAALARAKSESKGVFVYFSAPGCGWCKKLDAYVRRDDIAKVFDAAYVPLKIDVDRMTGGHELDAKLRGDERGGIPFFVVLDSAGKKLADSNGPKGNIGFPVEPDEIAHFMGVVRQTSPRLDAAALRVLEDGLRPSR